MHICISYLMISPITSYITEICIPSAIISCYPEPRISALSPLPL